MKIESTVGWINWSPKPGCDRDRYVNFALAKLDEYSKVDGMLPIGSRQLAYRALDAGIVKTKSQFSNFEKTVALMRRSLIIPMDWIADGRSMTNEGYDYEDSKELTSNIMWLLDNASFDLQHGQKTRVDLWIETQGQAPQFAPLAELYGCSLLSGSGSDPITLRHDRFHLYKQWIDEGKCEDVAVLHWGDYDLHGIQIFNKLKQDQVDGWGRGYPIHMIRSALTEDQVIAMGRSPEEKIQLEMLDPFELVRMVKTRVENLLDLEKLEAAKDRQDQQRAEAVKGALEALEERK
jgi:hypothetical protein